MIGHSSKIIGLDISETQLGVARREVVDDSLTFEIGNCENIPVEDGSVDVVTAVQAAHYFNIPLFLKEVDRVLAPGGVVSLACYLCPTTPTSPELTFAIKQVNDSLLRPFFPASRYDIMQENRYRNAPFLYPVSEFEVDLRTEATFEDVLYLLSSWSGFQNYCTYYKLTPEEGMVSIDQFMSRFIKQDDKHRTHALSTISSMCAAKKPE